MEFFNYNQDFFRLRQFYFVAKAGSLSGAAKLLKMTHPALSKSMQCLQHRLKAQLFTREPKGMKLTADGERLYEHVTKLFQENDEFLKDFYNPHNEVNGEIKIITTPAVAEIELTSYLMPLLETYPKLRIGITTSIDNFELQNYDVAIRTSIPYRPDLEQLPLHTHHHKLWASSDYLKKFGVPKTPEELNSHRLLSFKPAQDNDYIDNYSWINWILRIGNDPSKPRRPFYQLTSNEGLHSAACKGYGIVQLPKEWIALKNSPLISVLPNLEEPKVELYFICNKNGLKNKRIKILYDYLKEIIKTSM